MKPKDNANPLAKAAALYANGKLQAAAEIYRKLITDDGGPMAYCGLGTALVDLGEAQEALSVYGSGLTRYPDDLQLAEGRAVSLERLKRTGDAIAAYRAIVAKNAASFLAWNNLGGLLIRQGRNQEAMEAFVQALALKPANAACHSNILFVANYNDRENQAALYARHLEWADRHATPLSVASPQFSNSPDPDRRLRIGYISPDFWSHPVAYFIGAIIAAHDRVGFEVYCYSTAKRTDRVTESLRRLRVVWRDIAWLDDESVSSIIRADQIDTLVDLAGHTAGNRLLVLARKPAPIQITYLGYPNTTGMSAIGSRFTDVWADPPGDADRQHSETLIRLPGGFLAYTPPSNMPQVGELPARREGRITFGSFTNLAKISSATIALWSRALMTVPKSRLLIKTVEFADEKTRAYFFGLFGDYGITKVRLLLLSEPSAATAHYDTWNRVDIALDTLPYNAATTTCEALWMGVPVITLAGERHAARVGASLLNAAGLPQFVTTTPDEFIAAVAKLANDLDGLAALRASLRTRLTGSPLLDPRRLTRAMEQAYRNLWRRWCAEQTGS